MHALVYACVYVYRVTSLVYILACTCRADVRGAVVAVAAGASGEHVGLRGTPASRRLRCGHVLPSQVPLAGRHVQQPASADARIVAVAAAETAAAAIRKQLQLACWSVLLLLLLPVNLLCR